MNFKLTHIPSRDAKPRTKGVTMMMDKGMSLREAENFLESSGHLTDLVKLGFGTSYMTPNLKEKIKLYQDAGQKVYFGGTLFEAFYVRNKLNDYKKLVDEMGMDCVEISDGSVIIPHDEKCEIIAKMSKNYTTVLSEVGSKEAGIMISPAKWIKMMNNELEAGSWKVIAEGRESGSVGIFRPNGRPHTMLVNKIISKVKPENILWEAPVKNQQVWFINLFGANVNLGNISANDMIPLECLRIGLRGDTFFNYLPENIVKTKKQASE